MHSPAPDFTLPDQNGVERSLKDYRGRWVVVYFYPFDGSPNCSREACNFRDEYKIINQFGNAEVIGINKGSVSSHKKFATRYKINYPVLSDKGHAVTSAFGAWRSNKPKFYDTAFGTRRNTYIINPKGIIVKSYYSVAVNDHVQQVIEDLQTLQMTAVSRA